MRDSALVAERDALHARCMAKKVPISTATKDWVIVNRNYRSNSTCLDEMVLFTPKISGRFSMNMRCVVFENKQDAIIYKIMCAGS